MRASTAAGIACSECGQSGSDVDAWWRLPSGTSCVLFRLRVAMAQKKGETCTHLHYKRGSSWELLGKPNCLWR